MRFVHNRTGLERLKRNIYSYASGTMSNYNNISKVKKEETQDTQIRRDIHTTIIKMAKDNKSSIEIKTTLAEKYPNYEEYIIKMINQYFTKLNSNKRKEASDTEKGDER